MQSENIKKQQPYCHNTIQQRHLIINKRITLNYLNIRNVNLTDNQRLVFLFNYYFDHLSADKYNEIKFIILVWKNLFSKKFLNNLILTFSCLNMWICAGLSFASCWVVTTGRPAIIILCQKCYHFSNLVILLTLRPLWFCNTHILCHWVNIQHISYIIDD